MKEQIHVYGEHRNLQGIATIPDNINNKLPVVILLNSGVLHKVGPFDLNISTARSIHTRGCLVFRFDLSGMGDSTKIKDGSSHHESVINDLKETMNFIEKYYSLNKFVIIGLCTGADHAHKIACADSRVVGNVWLDGYGYPTLKYRLIRYLPVALNPSRLINACLKVVHISLGLSAKSIKGVDDYVWKLPAKEQYKKDLETLVSRNMKFLYIYSGGVDEYYNYKNQFFDSFKGCEFLKNIEVDYYPLFDHTYIILKDRYIMLKRIGDWLESSFL